MTDPGFVLVPGAGGAAWYWHRVAAELRARGRDVVAVDLPAADEKAGLPEYAEVVAEAAAGRESVVLVGQSLGGFTASLVAPRLPVRVLVLVNAMIPEPGETPGQWWENTGQPEAMRESDARAGRQVGAEFDPETYFLHDVPREVLEGAEDHDHPESAAVFATPWTLPAWPDVPTKVLTGRDDRFFPAAFQRRVSRARLGITPDEIPGGHLLALSQPTPLTNHLEHYTANP